MVENSKKILIDSQLEEFEAVCKPVAEWLQKNRLPLDAAYITVDRCTLLTELMGVPVELPDGY